MNGFSLKKGIQLIQYFGFFSSLFLSLIFFHSPKQNYSINIRFFFRKPKQKHVITRNAGDYQFNKHYPLVQRNLYICVLGPKHTKKKHNRKRIRDSRTYLYGKRSYIIMQYYTHALTGLCFHLFIFFSLVFSFHSPHHFHLSYFMCTQHFCVV